jgi:hypothetical protein
MADLELMERLKKWHELKKKKDGLTIDLELVNGEIEQLKEAVKAKLLEQGVSKLSFEDQTVFLKASAYNTIVDSDGLIKWLDQEGAADVAIRTINKPRLKELLETRLEKDLAFPPDTLLELKPKTEVVMRAGGRKAG